MKITGYMDFTQRSYEKELLDRDDIPFDAIRQNMRELDVINTWLGGHRITIRGFRALTGNMRNVHVCEIGCGGGDNLKAIWRWAKKHGIGLRMTGIDIKQECIDHAKEACSGIPDTEWICADYRQAIFIQKPDIIFNSLFCHHFSDEGVTEIIEWMYVNSRKGFFVNDLQRHPLAYHAIRMLTSIFSGSELVRNDAPLSVLRGFSRDEWLKLIGRSQHLHGDLQFNIRYQWAFRWLVTAKKNDGN
jgi:2-polyprenyl-3-methyl-5-hydroxy-6-metoxy-1,4-benzoquinol methylase